MLRSKRISKTHESIKWNVSASTQEKVQTNFWWNKVATIKAFFENLISYTTPLTFFNNKNEVGGFPIKSSSLVYRGAVLFLEFLLEFCVTKYCTFSFTIIYYEKW